MQRTHSHYTVCKHLVRLEKIGGTDETTLSERRIRNLEDFVLRAVVTASYGGAGLVEVLMRGTRRAFAVLAHQRHSF